MQSKHVKLLPHQMDVLKSTEPLYGIIGGRGTGKSVIVAILACMAFQRNERIIVLAQTSKSISENIWREIQHWLDEFGIAYKANNSSMTIDNGKGGRIITGSYQALDALRGLTNCSLLICDEIAYAPADLFAVVAPCLRGAGIKPIIRFATSPCMHSWWNRYVKENNVKYAFATTFDNTFLTSESIALMEQSIKNETLRRQELYGEMLDGVVDNAIVSDKDFVNHKNQSLPTQNYYIGVDCSGYGKDNNAVIIRNDQEILAQWKEQIATSNVIEAYIESKINEYGPTYLSGIYIDMAYGNALYEKLSEKYTTYLVPFGSKADDNQYFNKRTEMYMNLANAIKDGFLIEDKDIRYNLSNTTFQLKGDKIALDPKETIKEIIGHSPDVEDALALTFYDKLNTSFGERYTHNKKADQAYYETWLSGAF